MSGELITVVVYGDDVHLFSAGDLRAEALYLSKIHNGFEAEMVWVPADDYAQALAKIGEMPGVTITDHRH